MAGVVTVCSLGAMQQQCSVSRFQLFEGAYLICGEDALVNTPSVWRIDTVTGETVKYFLADKRNGWARVSDFPVD